MQRWAGRVALVTGASSGIGRAIAERLADRGLRVVAAARRMEQLQTLRDEVRQRGSGPVLPLQVDLRDEAQIVRMFEQVREHWGGVDVLVNNAGLGRHAPLTEGETERWREMLEVNVLALCICTREAVQDMKRRGGEGHVIHISSMAAHRVPHASGVYSATKYAVRSLTEGLRQELHDAGSPIRVSSLSPGLVQTEFHGDPERARRQFGELEMLAPADVASTVEHVLSAPPRMQVHDVLMRPREQGN